MSKRADGRRELGKRKASLLFVVQMGDGERDECGLGLQGLTTLLRSGIPDIPSVTLSAGGQAFQTGHPEGGREGGRETREGPKLVSNQRKTQQRHTADELVLLQSKRVLQPSAVGTG